MQSQYAPLQDSATKSAATCRTECVTAGRKRDFDDANSDRTNFSLCTARSH
jgi:hypothetical protein